MKRQYFAAAGILGTLIITICSILTALAYTGKFDQRYSPLNHFISELGEVGVSEWAAVFNVGLIVGGALLAAYLIGLALTLNGWMRYAFGALGLVSGIAGALVGVFPMNNLDAHATVALTFFNTGGIVVGLYSLYILFGKQTMFPRWIVLIGAASAVSFAGFLSIINTVGAAGLAAPEGARPDVRPITVWEWAILITVLAWMLVTAIYLWRATRPTETTL